MSAEGKPVPTPLRNQCHSCKIPSDICQTLTTCPTCGVVQYCSEKCSQQDKNHHMLSCHSEAKQVIEKQEGIQPTTKLTTATEHFYDFIHKHEDKWNQNLKTIKSKKLHHKHLLEFSETTGELLQCTTIEQLKMRGLVMRLNEVVHNSLKTKKLNQFCILIRINNSSEHAYLRIQNC